MSETFESFKNKIEGYGPGLYYFPAKLLLLEEAVIDKFMKFLITTVFNPPSIYGQESYFYLLRMPSIGEIARRLNETIEKEVDLDDSCAYRELLSFYKYYDSKMEDKYISIGLGSNSQSIYEIACEFRGGGKNGN